MFEFTDFIYWWTHLTFGKFMVLVYTAPVFLITWKLAGIPYGISAWLASAMLIYIMRIKWLYSRYPWYWATALCASALQFVFVLYWPVRLAIALLGLGFCTASLVTDFLVLYYLFSFAGKLMNAPLEKEFIYD